MQNTSYDMRISDWSSDVCSSDLASATLTSMANAILREKIEALGYKTEITGKHGAFELLGPNGEKINKEALDGFSKRGNDIKRSEDRRVGNEWVRTCRSR